MCTGIRFTDTDGNMFWGRNLDWNVGYGQHPIVMPKGFTFNRKFGESFKTKSAVIGMGIEFEGFPLYFDCANDAGLACGGLNFPGYAVFAKSEVAGKNNIAAYEFPAWICANFKSVDEVCKSLENTEIIGIAPSPELGVGMLHWMIADATRSIVIETRDDGMHIYEDKVDVLTNQPPFDWHMENLRNYMNCSNTWAGEVTWTKDKMEPFGTGATMRGIPGDTYSTSRFVRAAFVNAFHPQVVTEADNVIRMFHILGNASFVIGCAGMADGSFEYTLFSDCYSASTGNFYYNTYENPAIRYVRLHDYDNADASKLISPKEYLS